MTASAAQTTPAGAVTTGPERSVPQGLVDLAILAIRCGAHKVSLGHDSLGFDFHAPIGWLLWITQYDPALQPEGDDDEDEDNSALEWHQIGCDPSDITAPAWLAESAADGSDDLVVIEDLLELFQAGVANGWDVAYERHESEHLIFQSIAKTYSIENPSGMRHQLRATANNWAYDSIAHARGDHALTEVVLSVCEGSQPDVLAFSDDGGTHRQVEWSHAAALLRTTAPDFVPVAYFDYQLERWVL